MFQTNKIITNRTTQNVLVIYIFFFKYLYFKKVNHFFNVSFLKLKCSKYSYVVCVIVKYIIRSYFKNIFN
jgi:hypothetical protein